MMLPVPNAVNVVPRKQLQPHKQLLTIQTPGKYQLPVTKQKP